MYIGAKGHILCCLDREAAVCVHRSFGTAGCPGGVEYHQYVFSVGGFESGLIRLGRYQIVPPMVTPALHRNIVPCPLEHDDVLHGPNLCCRLVSGQFERNDLPAPEEAVSGEQPFGTGIVQASGDRSGPEAGEQRQNDAPDLANRKKSDNDFRRHRHVQSNGVAFNEA